MMLVDSHCHLDFATPEERPEIIARARRAGVVTMLTIGTKISEFAEVLEIAAERPRHMVFGRHSSTRGGGGGRSSGGADGADAACKGRRDRRNRARFPLRPRTARRARTAFRAHCAASRETNFP